MKNFQHVFVIMMENTRFGQLIGNSNAPWINMAADTFGVALDYHGVAHPSQPNYIAATSGGLNNVTGDGDVTIDVPNIADQIENVGKTWKGYMQSYSTCTTKLQSLCPSSAQPLYARKHNPFVSYADIQNNSARMANLVDFSQFSVDLASGSAPDYAWISPDQCHDMHGIAAAASNPCSFSNEQQLISTGDTFLSDTVTKIMSSSAWTGNSVIFITWDETDFPFIDTTGCCDAIPGGGHVLTLVISHSNHTHVTSTVPYNHYTMLRTIEDGWKLGCLVKTCDTSNVPAMGDLTGPRG